MGQNNVNKTPPTNEIVDFLRLYDKSKVTELESSFPEYQKLFKEGMMMGENRVETVNEELKVRAEITKKGLQLILKKSEELLPKVKSKIKKLNSIQFISQVVVAISGASILLSLEKKFNFITPLVGVLTLVASLLTLFIQHKSGTIAFGDNSLSQLFNELTDYKLKAERFLEELIIAERLDYSSSIEKVSQIINESNDISLEMKKIIAKY